MVSTKSCVPLQEVHEIVQVDKLPSREIRITFKRSTGRKDWLLRADTEAEMKEWLTAVTATWTAAGMRGDGDGSGRLRPHRVSVTSQCSFPGCYRAKHGIWDVCLRHHQQTPSRGGDGTERMTISSDGLGGGVGGHGEPGTRGSLPGASSFGGSGHEDVTVWDEEEDTSDPLFGDAVLYDTRKGGPALACQHAQAAASSLDARRALGIAAASPWGENGRQNTDPILSVTVCERASQYKSLQCVLEYTWVEENRHRCLEYIGALSTWVEENRHRCAVVLK
jgi:hypothetical protein